MKSIFSLKLFLVILLLFNISLGSLPTSSAAQIDQVPQEYTPASFAGAAEAAAITSDALREAKHLLRRAYSEDISQAQVSHHLETIMRAEGADGALSFPTLTISGSELEEPHGNPTDNEYHMIRPITEPIVMIDIGCKYNSHCTDVTRTFFFESATQEMFDAYEAVLEAELAVIEAIAPGVLITDLDDIVDSVLSDYAGVEEISLLTIWGHGVGRYVHEMPMLYGGAAGEYLLEGDVLAIEPGIYSEDGWAVRVEDTVLVTSTGYEVLSDTPKSLSDVMVNSSLPKVSAEIAIGEYEYDSQTSVNIEVTDSGGREIDSVYHFDGYRWTQTDLIIGTQFERSYFIDYSYSSSIDCLMRVHIGNETFYFPYHMEAEAEATSQIELEFPIVVAPGTYNPPLFWFFKESNTSMIRFKFDVFDGPEFDQMLIMDSNYSVFADLMNEGAKHRWTPWIAGDYIILQIVPTEGPVFGGVGEFSLNISIYEVIEIPTEPTTTTNPTSTTTSATSTTSETTSSNTTSTNTEGVTQEYTGMILGFVSGFAGFLAVGLILFRRERN